MLIETVFAEIRDTLSDPTNSRWSNERLLRAFNSAIRDVAIHTEIFTKTERISILANQANYNLPINFISLIRAYTKSSVLAVVSVEEMLNFKIDWQADSNEKASHLVLNNLDYSIYPKPLIDTYINLNYSYIPPNITVFSGETNLPNILSQALKYYVCGMLFKDDFDAQNLEASTRELSLYERELTRLKALKVKNFSNEQFGTNYFNGFNELNYGN